MFSRVNRQSLMSISLPTKIPLIHREGQLQSCRKGSKISWILAAVRIFMSPKELALIT